MRYVIATIIGCILLGLAQAHVRGVAPGGELALPIIAVFVAYLAGKEDETHE